MRHTITLLLLILASVTYAQDTTPTPATNRWVSEVMTKPAETNAEPTLPGASTSSLKELFNANDN